MNYCVLAWSSLILEGNVFLGDAGGGDGGAVERLAGDSLLMGRGSLHQRSRQLCRYMLSTLEQNSHGKGVLCPSGE